MNTFVYKSNHSINCTPKSAVLCFAVCDLCRIWLISYPAFLLYISTSFPGAGSRRVAVLEELTHGYLSEQAFLMNHSLLTGTHGAPSHTRQGWPLRDVFVSGSGFWDCEVSGCSPTHGRRKSTRHHNLPPALCLQDEL